MSTLNQPTGKSANMFAKALVQLDDEELASMPSHWMTPSHSNIENELTRLDKDRVKIGRDAVKLKEWNEEMPGFVAFTHQQGMTLYSQLNDTNWRLMCHNIGLLEKSAVSLAVQNFAKSLTPVMKELLFKAESEAIRAESAVELKKYRDGFYRMKKEKKDAIKAQHASQQLSDKTLQAFQAEIAKLHAEASNSKPLGEYNALLEQKLELEGKMLNLESRIGNMVSTDKFNSVIDELKTAKQDLNNATKSGPATASMPSDYDELREENQSLKKQVKDLLPFKNVSEELTKLEKAINNKQEDQATYNAIVDRMLEVLHIKVGKQVEDKLAKALVVMGKDMKQMMMGASTIAAADMIEHFVHVLEGLSHEQLRGLLAQCFRVLGVDFGLLLQQQQTALSSIAITQVSDRMANSIKRSFNQIVNDRDATHKLVQLQEELAMANRQRARYAEQAKSAANAYRT